MQIGQIDFPAVGEFSITDHSRKSEHIAPLGMQGFVPAEFLPELPNVLLSGHLLKTFANTRTLFQRAEDLQALTDRRSAYHFVYNVHGKSGWIAFDSIRPSTNDGQLWTFSTAGKWYDASRYCLKYFTQPKQIACSKTITAGNNYICVPVDAIVYDTGTEVDISTEDGNTKHIISSTNTITFDLVGSDYINGECKVFDGTTQIYNNNHNYSDYILIKNGTYRVKINTNTIKIDYWDGTNFVNIDTFTCGTFSKWWTVYNNPDCVKVQMNSGAYVEIERGKVPHLYVPTLIDTTDIALSTASTIGNVGINYLEISNNIFVAGNGDVATSESGITSGHRWIFFNVDGTESQHSRDVLMISNIRRQIVERGEVL